MIQPLYQEWEGVDEEEEEERGEGKDDEYGDVGPLMHTGRLPSDLIDHAASISAKTAKELCPTLLGRCPSCGCEVFHS